MNTNHLGGEHDSENSQNGRGYNIANPKSDSRSCDVPTWSTKGTRLVRRIRILRNIRILNRCRISGFFSNTFIYRRIFGANRITFRSSNKSCRSRDRSRNDGSNTTSRRIRFLYELGRKPKRRRFRIPSTDGSDLLSISDQGRRKTFLGRSDF